MEVGKKEGCCRKTVRISSTNGVVEKSTDTDNREMQLFLLSYIVISIAEIFTVGKFPLNNTARIVSRKNMSVNDIY
jgi:hypothetical protein